MKKTYSKPEIAFESFSLSQNIAGDCEVKTGLPSNTTCGMDFSGVTIFLDHISGCEEKIKSYGGDGSYNGICYHVPNENNNLFNS